jgi:hypothetical protein
MGSLWRKILVTEFSIDNHNGILGGCLNKSILTRCAVKSGLNPSLEERSLKLRGDLPRLYLHPTCEPSLSCEASVLPIGSGRVP